MKNDIQLQDLQDWIEGTDVTFAHSPRENKRITCSLNGTIKVTVAGKIIHMGMKTYPAMEAYNSITEKYIDPLKDFKI